MACNIFLNLGGNVKMPALGYGTWQSADESLEKALEVALETGYRHIDTAQAYNNEEIIGRVLKKWFDSGRLKREDIFITTKLWHGSLYPEKVEECLKVSLEKLQLEYVDLYLLHFPITMIPEGDHYIGHPNNDYVAVWKAMEKQYDAGRARTIGVSNYSVKKIQKILDNCRIKPANNQVEMHVYFQQKELVDFCNKNGVTTVAYAPLGPQSYFSFSKVMGEEPQAKASPLQDEIVLDIAKKHSKTPAQIILRFLLQLGVSAIPKSVTPTRVQENFDLFDFSLDADDMSKLRALDQGQKGRVYDFTDFKLFQIADHPDCEF